MSSIFININYDRDKTETCRKKRSPLRELFIRVVCVASVRGTAETGESNVVFI